MALFFCIVCSIGTRVFVESGLEDLNFCTYCINVCALKSETVIQVSYIVKYSPARVVNDPRTYAIITGRSPDTIT